MSQPHSRNHQPADDERTLSERLRQDARRAEPEFSERLHRNICQAVRRVQADAVSLPAVRGPWGVWPWATLAVAAVLLMALVFAWANPKLSVDGQPNSQATDPAFIAVAQSPGPPLLPGLMGRAALEVDRLIAEKLMGEQWTYLEHDASVLANALTGGSLRRLIHAADSAPEPSSTQRRPEG